MSTYTKNRIALIVYNSNLPVDRHKELIAYEIGNLAIGITPHLQKEKLVFLSDDFAQQFLLPETIYLDALSNLNFQKIFSLSQKWNISKQFIAKRAFTLNLLKYKSYKYILSEIVRYDKRNKYVEFTYQKENPFENFSDKIYIVKKEYKYFNEDLAAKTNLYMPDFKYLFSYPKESNLSHEILNY